MEKHYLASANSCAGFTNCFNSINTSKDGFTFILKGGPGTGKSTIMKKVGKKYQDKGYKVEYFYCSSDPQSLDGVRVPKKNIAVVDGTAPHVTEASIPNVKEKIVNVGAFIKPEIIKHKKIIASNLSKKSKCFVLAYNYLKSINGLLEVEKLENKIGKVPIKIENLLPLSAQKHFGKERKLFCSYISSTGIKYLYNQNKYKNVIYLKNSFFENCNTLNLLAKKLKDYNYNFISFLSILDPNLKESIFIEELETLVLAFDPNKGQITNFKNKKIIDSLIKKAGKNIEKAKDYHKKVETFYIANMDFESLNKFMSQVSDIFI